MRSILRDRNAEKAKILNKQETEKHVILKLKDRSDEITIKRVGILTDRRFQRIELW